MPGSPIIYRAIDFGYVEPTKIYTIVENDKGDWEMHKEYEATHLSVDEIAAFIKDHTVAPMKPIVVPPSDPRLRDELKKKGLRVL